MKQIHTHEGPSDKSIVLHKAHPVKSTPPSPPLFHQGNGTEKYPFSTYSGNIYVHLCVPPFQFSVSWFSEMQFGVIYLASWDTIQPYVAFSTLEFRSCVFGFGGTPWRRILLHGISQLATLRSCFKSPTCLAYRMLWLWQGTDRPVALKTDISTMVGFKEVSKKSLQQNEGHLPVVPYCTNQSNERLYAFLTSPTDSNMNSFGTHWPLNPGKTSLTRSSVMKRCEVYRQLKIL
jgi:hypothetical protein